jgi:hypothetical protein
MQYKSHPSVALEASLRPLLAMQHPFEDVKDGCGVIVGSFGLNRILKIPNS